MIPKDSEPTRFLEVPWISPKTPIEQIREYSRQRWQSDGRKRIAADIVQNGKELLAGSNTDWKLVLGSIRTEQLGSVYYGESAIAKYDAHLIGALAVAAGWSMHDRAIVYISATCIADRASSKLEGFRQTMLQAAVSYGQKTLTDANLYIQTLDFLFGVVDRNNNRDTIRGVAELLGQGKIEDAYNKVKDRGYLVSRRGP